MSIESWKAEFYPIEAKDVKGDDLERIDHALLKWSGVTEENLKKHEITDRLTLPLCERDCTLCRKYLVNCETVTGSRCPIVRFQYGQSERTCYDAYKETVYGSKVGWNTNPMLELLKKVKEWIENSS